MAYDLVPNNWFSFPSIKIPSIWEDDDWLAGVTSASGLSISEDENNIYIETSLPGIDPQNIDITFQDGYLWVRGEEKEEDKDKNRKYYRHSSKAFSYRVAVPGDIDINSEPQATYKHGIMTVAFMKSPKSQPKKIQIKTE